MTVIDGGALRQWRRSRDWDVPEMARRLRMAAVGDSLAEPHALVRMIRRWERNGLSTSKSERYELLYAKVLDIEPAQLRRAPSDTDAVAELPADLRMPTGPGLTLRELNHISRALDDARRYTGREAAGYFAQRLTDLAAGDGAKGPREMLAPVLGLMTAIDRAAQEASADLRHDLLVTGATAAEFLAWLYRDSRSRRDADTWLGQAMELAMEAGHLELIGYIMLRQAQDAWDVRDGARMLSLAQAAQRPTWQVPPRVRAEAAQQEARGLAMTGGDTGRMRAKLQEAEDLADGAAGQNGLGSGYSRPLLAMQTAICYDVAGQSAHAALVYEQELTEARFSRRDFGFFRALQSGTLAAAGEPHAACVTGLEAVEIARETASTRTMGELARTATALEPWQSDADVREFRASLTVL